MNILSKEEIKQFLKSLKARQQQTDDYHVATRREQMAAEEKFLVEAIAAGKVCEKCLRNDMLTVDHIIPLKLLTDLGFDLPRFLDPENLRILCKLCNQLKADHLDFSCVKTKTLLIKYLERL